MLPFSKSKSGIHPAETDAKTPMKSGEITTLKVNPENIILAQFCGLMELANVPDRLKCHWNMVRCSIFRGSGFSASIREPGYEQGTDTDSTAGEGGNSSWKS